MVDDLDRRRKRVRFRSLRRGTREGDFIIGGFAAQYADELSAEQLDRFEALLEKNDPEVMAWITGTKPVPLEWDTDVMHLLQKFKNTLSTR